MFASRKLTAHIISHFILHLSFFLSTQSFQQPTNSKYANSLMESQAAHTTGGSNSFSTAVNNAANAVTDFEVIWGGFGLFVVLGCFMSSLDVVVCCSFVMPFILLFCYVTSFVDVCCVCNIAFGHCSIVLLSNNG